MTDERAKEIQEEAVRLGALSVEYGNDVGPNDEGFWEWWEVLNSDFSFSAKCAMKADANVIARLPTYIKELLEERERLKKRVRKADEKFAAIDEIVALMLSFLENPNDENRQKLLVRALSDRIAVLQSGAGDTNDTNT